MEVPSKACGRPSIGRMPAPWGPSPRSACPPSCPGGPKIGNLGPTSWRRSSEPSSPTGTLANKENRCASLAHGGPRWSCPTGQGAPRCSHGQLWQEWPESALTQRAPEEGPCGPRRRGPQERCGSPSTRGKASTRPSSTSSRIWRAPSPKVLGPRLGQSCAQRHQGHLPARGPEGCPACGRKPSEPPQLREGQGVRPAQVRPSPRRPSEGSLWIHPGGLHLDGDLCQGGDMQG